MSFLYQSILENKPFSTFWGDLLFCVLISLAVTMASQIASARRWRKQNEITNEQAQDIEALRADLKEQEAFGANAWADYQVRRDVYLEAIALTNVFFDKAAAARMGEFLTVARKIRLLGTYEVVRALNEVTCACRMGSTVPEAQQKEVLMKFMHELRVDIRSLRRRPTEGTELTYEDFLIETQIERGLCGRVSLF